MQSWCLIILHTSRAQHKQPKNIEGSLPIFVFKIFKIFQFDFVQLSRPLVMVHIKTLMNWWISAFKAQPSLVGSGWRCGQSQGELVRTVKLLLRQHTNTHLSPIGSTGGGIVATYYSVQLVLLLLYAAASQFSIWESLVIAGSGIGEPTMGGNKQ